MSAQPFNTATPPLACTPKQREPWGVSLRAKQRGCQLFAALGLLWLGFMLWGCLDDSPSGTGLIARFWPWLAQQPYADKVSHAGIHAILAGCLWVAGLCGAYVSQRRWRWHGGCAVVVLCFALGVGIELLQHYFTQTRQGDVWDALANGLGALLAVLMLEAALSLWHHIRQR